MGKKKVRAVLKLELQAGKATPAPPVGTALGPHGINIMEFTKAYNERTAQQAGDVVPALITIFEDRSFSFVLKTPPAVQLLKRAAGVDKGSAKPNREKIGRVTRQQLRQIVELKRKDLNAYEPDAAMKMIEGTARSMGLERRTSGSGLTPATRSRWSAVRSFCPTAPVRRFASRFSLSETGRGRPRRPAPTLSVATTW